MGKAVDFASVRVGARVDGRDRWVKMAPGEGKSSIAAQEFGLLTSIRASYLVSEIPALIEGVGFSSYEVKRGAMGLQIPAIK